MDPVETLAHALAHRHGVSTFRHHAGKRGMLKVWNMALIFATFELCLLGTFLTRSV